MNMVSDMRLPFDILEDHATILGAVYAATHCERSHAVGNEGSLGECGFVQAVIPGCHATMIVLIELAGDCEIDIGVSPFRASVSHVLEVESHDLAQTKRSCRGTAARVVIAFVPDDGCEELRVHSIFISDPRDDGGVIMR